MKNWLKEKWYWLLLVLLIVILIGSGSLIWHSSKQKHDRTPSSRVHQSQSSSKSSSETVHSQSTSTSSNSSFSLTDQEIKNWAIAQYSKENSDDSLSKDTLSAEIVDRSGDFAYITVYDEIDSIKEAVAHYRFNNSSEVLEKQIGSPYGSWGAVSDHYFE